MPVKSRNIQAAHRCPHSPPDWPNDPRDDSSVRGIRRVGSSRARLEATSPREGGPRARRGLGRTATRALSQAVTCAAIVAFVTAPIAPASADEPLFDYGNSDASSVAVLSGSYDQSGGPGTPYWYDHTNLTVAVVAKPNSDPQLVQAIHAGIATWSAFLADRLPIISLTDVTDTAANPQRADITLHYVPNSGGVVWGGLAVCGNQHCSNVMLRSHEPPGGPYRDFDPTRVHRMTVHELGHALGLGHASPLEESRDIMAYGWVQHVMDPNTGKYTYVYRTPILSDCDLAGIAATFQWAIDEEEPHPARVSSVTCYNDG